MNYNDMIKEFTENKENADIYNRLKLEDKLFIQAFYYFVLNKENTKTSKTTDFSKDLESLNFSNHFASLKQPLPPGDVSIAEEIERPQETTIEKLREPIVRKPIPNVPDEAYIIKDGKKTVDYDKLDELNDMTKSSSFICPSCLRSSILYVDNEDTSSDTLLFIVRELRGTAIRLAKIKKGERSLLHHVMTQEEVVLFYSSEEYRELLKDEVIKIEVSDNNKGTCVVCQETHTFSELSDAYKQPFKYTEYKPCQICGSEMASKINVTENGKIVKGETPPVKLSSSLTCEECGFTI